MKSFDLDFCSVNAAHVLRIEIFYAYRVSPTKSTKSRFFASYSESISRISISLKKERQYISVTRLTKARLASPLQL